jgi:hypothetical protein
MQRSTGCRRPRAERQPKKKKTAKVRKKKTADYADLRGSGGREGAARDGGELPQKTQASSTSPGCIALRRHPGQVPAVVMASRLVVTPNSKSKIARCSASGGDIVGRGAPRHFPKSALRLAARLRSFAPLGRLGPLARSPRRTTSPSHIGAARLTFAGGSRHFGMEGW